MLTFLKRTSSPVEVRTKDYGNLLIFEAWKHKQLVMKMTCVKKDASTLLIGDILPWGHRPEKNINKGYGSALMEELLNYAGRNGIRRITGNLSKHDRGHKERLHHFYRKFGFTVTEFENPDGDYDGKICKTLDI